MLRLMNGKVLVQEAVQLPRLLSSAQPENGIKLAQIQMGGELAYP